MKWEQRSCREEFKQYVAKKEKVVQRTFAKLDVDNSGYIDADELVKCCLPQLATGPLASCTPKARKLKHRPEVLARSCAYTNGCIGVWLTSDPTACRQEPCGSCGCQSASKTAST